VEQLTGYIPATRQYRGGYHPTQKPLRLLRHALLASSGEGDLVFDPLCGSGTTGVAARELGRFFVGAELEREYCAQDPSDPEGWRVA
jgi:site-specific DNA-methyltransferase (adenine-specific)